MLAREVELVPESTGLPEDEVENALSGPTNWILRYIKNIKYTFEIGSMHQVAKCGMTFLHRDRNI